MELETLCLHSEKDSDELNPLRALSFPIYQSATFSHTEIGHGHGFDYSRLQNPTREKLEQIVKGLEYGVDAIAFSSGMAAISAFLELFNPGDHIIIDKDLYGGSIRIFNDISQKNGLSFSRIDMYKDDITPLINENTVAVFLETPTNPMMNVTDLEKLSKITKAHNLLLVVDNTFLSPYLQNPLLLGADIVIHSGTKYLGGHHDTLAGFIVTNNDDIAYKIREIVKTVGSNLAPFDSWLILRGIQTLAIRMKAIEENAKQIVEWLQTQKNVTKVYYPGLKDHPGYEIMKKQARGFGGMITFEVDSKERAIYMLKNIKLVTFAESLGGNDTLLTYPLTQTHSEVPEELLAENGITDRVLRLSVGIENIKDIIDDLERVLNHE